MMTPILHSFAYVLDYLREQVADVSDADMVAQPTGIPNHPAWVIGHLTFTLQTLGEVIEVPPWLPDDFATRFGTGSVPVADAGRYPSKPAALDLLRDAQTRITRAAEALSPARLSEPFPAPAYLSVFPTISTFLTQVLVGHTSMHVGQITVWRKAMQFPPMRRAFE